MAVLARDPEYFLSSATGAQGKSLIYVQCTPGCVVDHLFVSTGFCWLRVSLGVIRFAASLCNFMFSAVCRPLISLEDGGLDKEMRTFGITRYVFAFRANNTYYS
jgi:hypothetical protein